MNPKTETPDISHRIRLASILLSLFGGMIILGIKYYAALISNSSALRSDALEGTVNVLAAAFGLGSILFAEKPADQDHPYGHGKIEYFAQAFEGGLISLAGFLILIDTILRFVHHETPKALGLGLKLSVISGILNGLIGISIYRIGKKYVSQTLVADGIHLLSDLVTTIALASGLLIYYFTGYSWIDPLLAIGIAFFLFKTGFNLVHASSKALLDAENPEILKQIVDQLNSIPRGKIITAHELKAQQFGRDTHVDLHVVVPEYLSIKEAHHEADLISRALRERLGFNSEVHTHIDPCERDFCGECSEANCSIRVSPFQRQEPFTVSEITKPGKH